MCSIMSSFMAFGMAYFPMIFCDNLFQDQKNDHEEALIRTLSCFFFFFFFSFYSLSSDNDRQVAIVYSIKLRVSKN